VGDYARRLASALSSQTVSVLVFTTIAPAKDPDLGLDIRPVVRRWNFAGLPNLLRQINAASPDIVHLQYPTIAYGAGLLPQLLVLTRRPFIVTIHEASFSRILRRLALYPFLVFADRVVATTSFEADYLRRMYPPVRRRLSVIRIGSNIPPAPERARDDNVVVYFGLIAPQRGIEDFLRLARLAHDRGEGWEFRIIGRVPRKGQPYADALLEASEDLPLSWLLDLSEDEVADQLAGASAAYLPFPDGASSRRGSLAAALVNGLPTVTTHGAATPRELVDGETVMFTDSAEEALGRIRVIFSDGQLSQTLSSGARRYGERLSWERIAGQHAALYIDVARAGDGLNRRLNHVEPRGPCARG
jgi:glycosyltransferase involved in cell wall biosynthesis